ncbi:spermatogenesis-associated protein 1 [Triplophysa dalaica]|uniref:spermatogenesis-associated protein 1 n=1 Tax=Triplophysa dalaica TaxID=1582913 RepID=UPI0024E02456|nr:spermatogenesis-associated protein 1 [Triplophysa dalaica]
MSGFTGRRNKTTQGVELHVFYVPEDQFDRRLNKVSADAVSAFISAGFIRVDSDMTLSDLRAELGCFLGLDRITDKYVFLKCVGRSLALVKFRQEGELTVKSFAPPFAPFPELYLLPVGEHDSGLCSSSLTPDTLVSSADHHSQDLLRPTCAPGQSKEPIKFPSINKRAQQSVHMPAEEKNGSDEDTQSTDTRHLIYSSHDQKDPEAKQSERHIAKRDVYSQVKMDTVTKTKHSFKRTSSGDPGLLVDADQSPVLVRKFNTSMTLKSSGEKSDHVVPVSRPNSPLPTVCCSQLSLYSLELYTQQTTTCDELIKEIKGLKDQRKPLEQTRQELLKKGRELLALNRHRRNQARDKWKRKYFDTKKATVQHETTLRSVRQELHTFYCKMLRQLQARESTRRQTQAGKLSSTKNDLIIQIMTESCEIDNLRKNVDDAKMKLATEIKLRNQASTELQALRAELMQKRSQI